MQNNSLVKGLLALLVLVAAASVFLAVSYNLRLRNLRAAQNVLQRAQNAANARAQFGQVIQVAGPELIEYSRKNPSLKPILDQHGLKLATNTPPAAAH